MIDYALLEVITTIEMVVELNQPNSPYQAEHMINYALLEVMNNHWDGCRIKPTQLSLEQVL